MRTNILQSVALTLGICTCGMAQAQYGGYAPYQPSYGSAPAPAYVPSAAPVHPSLRSPAPAARPQSPRDPYRLPAPGAPYRLISDEAGNSSPDPVGSGRLPQDPGATSQLGRPGLGGPGPGVPTQRDVPLQGDAGYAPPPPSGRFQAPPDAAPYPAASAGESLLPAPGRGPSHTEHPHTEHPHAGHSHAGHSHAADGSCSSCNVGHVYNEAAAAPWIGAEPGWGHGAMPLGEAAAPIKNWFGGGSLLFLDFQNGANERLVYDDMATGTTVLDTDAASPGSEMGFEAFVGRYFGAGKYALSASYFLFNPGEESLIVRPATAGDYQVAMPNWTRMYIDRDGDGTADDLGVGGDATDDTIFGAFDSGAAYRVRRDVDIQGLELNFISFGIGGAMRAGLAGDCGSCGQAGCGGMCRPMLPSCDNRFQLQVSHGLRWLQFKDDFEFATTMLANGYGNGDDDFYYDVETENDLIGYQFGTRADLCITRRVNLYAGGKFGIYGNNVDYRSRIGTRGAAAQVTDYYSTMQDQRVDVSDSDTVLASLGELDLGLGVRVTDCWSVTGGYRLIGVTNVATSVGSISADPANLADGHRVAADDSLLIHGGYLGVQYNW